MRQSLGYDGLVSNGSKGVVPRPHRRHAQKIIENQTVLCEHLPHSFNQVSVAAIVERVEHQYKRRNVPPGSLTLLNTSLRKFCRRPRNPTLSSGEGIDSVLEILSSYGCTPHEESESEATNVSRGVTQRGTLIR